MKHKCWNLISRSIRATPWRVQSQSFYLAKDPLALETQLALRYGILYVTEHCWFPSVANEEEAKDLEHYEECQLTTNNLLQGYAKSDAEPHYQEFEMMVILGEGLEDFYRKDIAAQVRLVATSTNLTFPTNCLGQGQNTRCFRGDDSGEG